MSYFAGNMKVCCIETVGKVEELNVRIAESFLVPTICFRAFILGTDNRPCFKYFFSVLVSLYLKSSSLEVIPS